MINLFNSFAASVADYIYSIDYRSLITIGPASMYTIIKKLLKQEWIYLHDGSDSRRKTYLLTSKGKEILEEDVKIRKMMIHLAEIGLKEEVE